MPFASPPRSRPRSSSYPGGNPPRLQKKNPKPEATTTTVSSIPKKSAPIHYCCLVDLFRSQRHLKKKKKKAVVVVVVGAVHRRRLSPTLVVRERRRRGISAGNKKRSGARTSYTGTGAGAGAGARTGSGTGTGAGGARSGIIRKRASFTATSLRASGVTSIYNPTAPLPPIPQEEEEEEEEEGTVSFGRAEVEEVEDTQASCPPTARHPLIIFVRAYKKRRRNQAGAEKQDEEAAAANAAADSKAARNRKSGGSSSGGSGGGGGGSGGQDVDVISPVPRAAHFHQEARNIVEHGFHRNRQSGEGGVERGVVFGQGYSVWSGQQQEEGAVPVIGKIERIMGNPLSNDFYTDRASGSGHSRNNSAVKAAAKEKKREPKRHSYPVVNTNNAPLRASSARPTTALELDTNLSPISPDETDISTARDFSPYSGDNGIFKALSPPPAAPAAIALRYPNVTALVRANIPGESVSKRSSFRSSHRTSNRSSYTQLHDGTGLSDHISSQYSRSRKDQKSPIPIHIEKADTPDPLPSPPAWAAFGGFGASRNSKSSSSQPSRISTISSGSERSADQSVKSSGHSHRLSWNGRSVLDLDPAPPPPVPSKRPTPPPPPPIVPSGSSSSSSSVEPRPLRRKDKNILLEPTSPPKFATAPRVRTSAFGSYRQKNYPHLPPIPPDPEDIAGGPGHLFLPTLMSRSGSNSKMSVLSVPSTISSFNTINTITRSTGLSPTPARHTPRNTPEPLADESRDSNRKSIGASTIMTETSETSNMTVAELELEMRKIRDRARRASEERRVSRRRHDQSWLAEEETERPGPGIGHRFF